MNRKKLKEIHKNRKKLKQLKNQTKLNQFNFSILYGNFFTEFAGLDYIQN